MLSQILILGLVTVAYGHGTVNQIQGANGVTAAAFGVSNTKVNQGQVQTLNKATGCGNVDIATEMDTAISTNQVPTTAADGTLTMNWAQLNAGSDGGGPGTFLVDVTGTGTKFAKGTITKNFADGGANSANSMTVQLAAGTACTGGSNGATCLGRVQNASGPFGGCFAFATADAGGAKAGVAAGGANAGAGSAKAATAANNAQAGGANQNGNGGKKATNKRRISAAQQ